MLRACGVTEKGRIRPTNQDCFAVDEERGLLIVADGLGGHRAGDVAARLAVDAVVETLAAAADTRWPFGFDPALSSAGNRLRTAISVANLRVLEASVTSEACAGMGTTIVVAMMDGDRLSVGHVGDSRFYLVSRDRIRQLTRDDSWLASVLQDDPTANPALLETHPFRHALTNVVGSARGTEVHVVEEELEGGELLLLSTDGIHGVLADDRIEQLMLDSGDVEQMAAGLVTAALARGSRDDCTAVVGRYLRD